MNCRRGLEPQPLLLPEIKSGKRAVSATTLIARPLPTVRVYCGYCGRIAELNACFCGYCGVRLQVK